jgi:hypothetical protein
MSANENPKVNEFPELTAFERSLAAFAPQPAPLDREALFFQAGEAAARRRFQNRTPLRRYGWPAAFAAMTAVAAALLMEAYHREAPCPETLPSLPTQQMTTATAPPLASPDDARPSETGVTGLMDYARLRDEIVRDDSFALLLATAAPPESAAESARPISSVELLNEILRDQ